MAKSLNVPASPSDLARLFFLAIHAGHRYKYTHTSTYITQLRSAGWKQWRKCHYLHFFLLQFLASSTPFKEFASPLTLSLCFDCCNSLISLSLSLSLSLGECVCVCVRACQLANETIKLIFRLNLPRPS